MASIKKTLPNTKYRKMTLAIHSVTAMIFFLWRSTSSWLFINSICANGFFVRGLSLEHFSRLYDKWFSDSERKKNWNYSVALVEESVAERANTWGWLCFQIRMSSVNIAPFTNAHTQTPSDKCQRKHEQSKQW